MSFESIEDWKLEARYKDHRKPEPKEEKPAPKLIQRGPKDDGMNVGKSHLGSNNIYHLVD